MPKEQFKEIMTDLRTRIAPLVEVAAAAKGVVQKGVGVEEGQDVGEMIANIMLGVRHLEDAAMRFGKAIQASEGGTSPLGGPKTPGQ